MILDRSSTSAPLKVPTIDAKAHRIRIAIGKAGLDGHINAVKLLAQACMQAGMEVVLAGFKQTPEQLVETALQEDVDLLAVSSLAGAHMTIARETLALLKKRGASDVRVVMGGIIPEEDRQPLLSSRGESGLHAERFQPRQDRRRSDRDERDARVRLKALTSLALANRDDLDGDMRRNHGRGCAATSRCSLRLAADALPGHHDLAIALAVVPSCSSRPGGGHDGFDIAQTM